MGSYDIIIFNVRTVFQRCREMNITLNTKTHDRSRPKKVLLLAMQYVPETDTIVFSQPRPLKELQSFLGLVNFYKKNSLIARPLYKVQQ